MKLNFITFFPFELRDEQVNGWSCTAVEFYRERGKNGTIQVGKDAVQKGLLIFVVGFFQIEIITLKCIPSVNPN